MNQSQSKMFVSTTCYNNTYAAVDRKQEQQFFLCECEEPNLQKWSDLYRQWSFVLQTWNFYILIFDRWYQIIGTVIVNHINGNKWLSADTLNISLNLNKVQPFYNCFDVFMPDRELMDFKVRQKMHQNLLVFKLISRLGFSWL